MSAKLYNITRNLIPISALILLASCSDDLLETTVGNGDTATVTFRTRLDVGINTRAISDGTSVDRLLVAVYENESASTESFRTEYALNDALTNGIELRLLSGHNYKVLFFAYDDDNTAYTISNDGTITADYSDYQDGGFAKMEQLDAFYTVSSVAVSGNKLENVTLTRPFAQLNFADDSTRPIAGTHKAKVIFDNVATSFNPFTAQSIGDVEHMIFSFTDFTDETLESDGNTYYYVATNYLFAPPSGTISATCRLKQAGNDAIISEHKLPAIAVAINKRTNVLGEIVQEPEDIWDGTTLTEPTIDSQNRYIIDETSDLAWIALHGNTLLANRTFVVTKDLNMDNHSLASLQLPTGSTIEGGGHSIYNITIDGGGLFGDVTDCTINRLVIDHITTTGAVSHVGALINTLKGNGKFTSVSVKNAVVATNNGAAGGFIGYAVRKSEKDRNEALTLSFSGCNIENTSVSGSKSEGVFVGLLSGYDYNETISFASDCTATNTTTADFTSPYAEGNEGKWLATTDYSKYNGWLGDETYNRGTVNYGGTRFIPCWDGSKRVTPLTDSNGATLIYSAFDLASLQGGSHSAVTFKENVDLGAQKPFTPISSISTLDGSNHTLYNLYVNITDWCGAFINQSSGTTTHKNLFFSNSSVSVMPTSGSETAFAATLCSYIEGNYTAENIKIDDAYVLGISKSGGLNGFITSSASFYTVKKVAISKLRLENSYLHLSGKTFAASGEMGGLVGFIQQSALIENSSVTNSFINCTNSILRHVNQFIGTTRLDDRSQRIDINNCSASGNTYEKDKDTKHELVGGFSLSVAQRSSVYVNGSKIKKL